MCSSLFLIILSISIFFSFLVINIKIFFKFEKEWCTFYNKKWYLQKQIVSTIVLNMQKDSWNIINSHQVLNFETLQVMEPIKKKIDNSIFYAPLVNFQRYKIMVLSIIHTTCCSFYDVGPNVIYFHNLNLVSLSSIWYNTITYNVEKIPFITSHDMHNTIVESMNKVTFMSLGFCFVLLWSFTKVN
jgi:hypothetical protein